MATFTPNKNLIVPAHNEFVDTWDTSAANPNYTTIDTAFSGTLLKNATGLSGTIALTQTEVTAPTIQISGAPVAAVTYTVPNAVGGFWTVRNTTTGGFAIGIASAAGGSTVLVPANQQLMVWCDGTATGMLLSNSVYSSTGVHFPDGSVQTTAANGSSLFQTQTVVAQPFINFTGIPNTVNNLELKFKGNVDTLNAAMFMRFFSASGSPDSASHYAWTQFSYNSTVVSLLAGTLATGIFLTGQLGNGALLPGPDGNVWINFIQDGFIQCNFVVSYLLNDNVTINGNTGNGTYGPSLGPITGLQLAVTAGLYTGSASLYTS